MCVDELSEVFSLEGPIAAAVPGYRLREAQLKLAGLIQQAMQERTMLVAEAGTGTGKTWAYLVPAFLGGDKVMVSTGTRALQDQLFYRDIPRLRQALQVSVDVALLKGRGNYVCHYHLDRTLTDDRSLTSRAEVAWLRHIQVFAGQSETGERSQLETVPEDAAIWQRVTSTRDNCLGQDCPYVRDCFVLKARRRAQDADVVVINHALYMADLALREEGVTELLPAVDLVVFDEAHQLPDVATRFLGNSVSSHQLLDLARQIEVAGLAHAREAAHWTDESARLETAARELRLRCAAIADLPGGKSTFQAIPDPDAFDEAFDAVLDALDRLIGIVDAVRDVHPDMLAACLNAQATRARLFAWSQPDRHGRYASAQAAPDASGDDIASSADDRHDAAGTSAGAEHGAVPDAVRWVEHTQTSMRMHQAPLTVAPLFSRSRASGQAWVFTSATLSVNRDFGHFVRQLGLDGARTGFWDSPFDYSAQGMLYVPRLPVPSHPQFDDLFVDALFPLIEASDGGVLVLCTTLRAVERIGNRLQQRLAQHERLSDRLLLRQGEASRPVLLERFREQGNAILVGSASFREGIDVPGDALSVVAIDRLPFAPPDDPVVQARLAYCRSQGGNPFMEYQLPEAAIALKQGAGRLIRSEQDRGLLMVGDSRLVDKPYGRVLWRGLPPFARTREPAAAVEFVRTSCAGSSS